MNMQEFTNPSEKYRGVTLWMLNDRLEKEELRRQMREIHEKGIGAVIGRTFVGLRTEYLSSEWMEYMRIIVDLAKELGMEVFFQAGYMPSGIPDQDPAYAHKALTTVPAGKDLEDGMKPLTQDGTFQYVETTRIHVLDMFNNEAVSQYLKGAYEDTWFTNFQSEFGGTISSVWVDEPHFNPPNIPWGPFLVERFIADWGYSVEEHVPSLFVEEGDYRKIRYHYWRTVTNLLLDGYFDQVSEWCRKHEVSFSGHLMGEDTLAAQIAFTGACMPLYEKMQLPGIDHLTMSLNWTHWRRNEEGEGVRFVLTPKQCSGAAHQFGKERILAEMYAVSSQGITFEDRKQIADWFFIMGINYRCLHGSFYSMKGRRKRIYAPHLSYQQPWWEDNRLISDYCNRMSYAMHQGRFCADVLLLHPVESAYCEFTAADAKAESPREVGLGLEETNREFCALSERLMKIHRGFEYGDESIMADRGSIEDGTLVIGEMRYRVVILPELITLRRSTIELLTAFMENGGTVLSAGAFPRLIDGEEDPAIEAFTQRVQSVNADERSMSAVLAAAVPPRFKIEPLTGDISHVFLNERELDEGAVMAFLANTSRFESVELTLSGMMKAGVRELMPVDGSECMLPVSVVSAGAGDSGKGRTAVSLSFAPLESHLLIFDPASAGDGETNSGIAHEKSSGKPGATRALTEIGSWRIARKHPNALTLDYCRLKRGHGEFGDVVPISVLQHLLTDYEPYAGPITLRCEFEVETVPSSIMVAMEEPEEADITVNGKTAPAFDGESYYWDKSFKPVDITALVVEGTNVIEFAIDFKPLEEPAFGLSRLFANIEGTELECFYLIGDFAVKCRPRKAEGEENVRYSQGFTIAAEPETVTGDLVDEGYPFFAGEIDLSAEFTIEDTATEAAGDKVVLALPGLESCVTEVEINGRSAGRIGWKPYEVDVTDLVKDGTNNVTLRLKNTLRNLLGPHHRPLVERLQNWGHNSFTGDVSVTTGKTYPEWWKDRSKDTDAWTEDYFFVRFGVYGPAEIRTGEDGGVGDGFSSGIGVCGNA